MIPSRLRLVRIFRERVGIVTKRRDLHFVLLAKRPNIVGMRVGEPLAVDMTRAAIRPILFRTGPTHDLDALITFAAGEGQNLFERQIAKDRGDESELHKTL